MPKKLIYMHLKEGLKGSGAATMIKHADQQKKRRVKRKRKLLRILLTDHTVVNQFGKNVFHIGNGAGDNAILIQFRHFSIAILL